MDDKSVAPANMTPDRRRFLETSGKVALAAPAVVLLLAAGTKTAHAIDNQKDPYTVVLDGAPGGF